MGTTWHSGAARRPFRGHVDDQVVQIAPVRGGEHLIDQAADHRAAHDGASLSGEAERNDADAFVRRRFYSSSLSVHLEHRLFWARHRGQRRAEHVRVEDADLRAHHRQGVRQIHGRGALPHAALTGGDGDDVPHSAHAGHGIRHVVCHRLRGHVHVHRGAPLDVTDETLRQPVELLLHRARGGGELERERHRAVGAPVRSLTKPQFTTSSPKSGSITLRSAAFIARPPRSSPLGADVIEGDEGEACARGVARTRGRSRPRAHLGAARSEAAPRPSAPPRVDLACAARRRVGGTPQRADDAIALVARARSW